MEPDWTQAERAPDDVALLVKAIAHLDPREWKALVLDCTDPEHFTPDELERLRSLTANARKRYP